MCVGGSCLLILNFASRGPTSKTLVLSTQKYISLINTTDETLYIFIYLTFKTVDLSEKSWKRRARLYFKWHDYCSFLRLLTFFSPEQNQCFILVRQSEEEWQESLKLK